MPSLREAAGLLKGEVSGNCVRCPGPQHSRTDRSLSVWFLPHAPSGFVVHSFAGDDPLRCRDHVREHLRLPVWRPNASRKGSVQQPETADQGQRSRIARSLTIWAEAVNPRGTIVDAYLRSRALKFRGDLVEALRFHPRLHFEGRTTGGMVALMRDVLTDEPCGIHRTFLDETGRKIDRRMLGRAKGAAIKLDPDEDVTLGLHVGEGIETCLAAQQLGYRPVWALGSAPAIAQLPVLPGVGSITVFAENDIASHSAAEACCAGYFHAGREAWICQPPFGDMNDIVRRVP
jgi:putative DNA primase/helicase